MQWYVLRKNKGSKETVVWQGVRGGGGKILKPTAQKDLTRKEMFK